MPKEKKAKKSKQINKSNFTKVTILVATGILAFLCIILPDLFSQSIYQLQIGEVATQEILAPYSYSYESEILTEIAKQEAAAKIEPIYLPADPGIGRHQIENLRTILYYITTIRQDIHGDIDQKLADLSAIQNVNFPEETSKYLLSTNDKVWEAIQLESTRLLEQVMRNTIRPTSLPQVKNNIPSIVDYSFPEEQTAIIIDLVSPMVVPNSLYSAEQTVDAKNNAAASVEPVFRSYIAGEALVRRGQILKSENLETLNKFGLIQQENGYQEIIGALIIVIVVCIFIGFYFKRRPLPFIRSTKSLLLIAGSFILFLALARFFIIDRTIMPYLYPTAAFGLTLSIIFNLEVGYIFTIALGVLTAFGTPNGFDLTLFHIIPALIGILILGKARRIGKFFAAGMGVGLIGAGIILSFRLPDSVTDWVGIATLSAASIINGLAASSITLLLQYVFSQLLDVTTPLQLLDLGRPDHPLLKFMLQNAPGSYQHSLMVSNLAENAAEEINANALLVRTGAIYHDCGKASNPQFFIENQIPDQLNSHDDVDNVTASSTIIQHVIDGVSLAQKYHLPGQVIDFIREHHGTLLTRYQYAKEVKASSNPEAIDQELYRYPGPAPRSRETAILMLADGVEARARAELPKDEIELKNLIKKVIDYYQIEGQLENTNLTLNNLSVISDSFFNSLRGIYHPRIQYPELKAGIKTSKVKI
ncbi:MAG: HDIG domain-containing protein [Anaerolineaceae bacterium]|nr:HDIG domain-containing protein [Anaerolineaceae bacterium]